MSTSRTICSVLSALSLLLAVGCSNQVDSIARLPLPEDNNDPGEVNNDDPDVGNNDDPDVGNNDDEALECETVEDCDPPADGTNLVVVCEESRCVEACADGFVDLNNDLSSDAEGDGCECEVTNGGVEICDGLDNDCDGNIDNDFVQNSALCPNSEVCFGVMPQTICDAGLESCDEEYYFAERTGSFIGFSGLELDDDGLDNNCDGTPDELLCERDGNLSPQRFLERQGDDRGVQQIQPQLASNFDSSPEETRLAVVWTETSDGDLRPGTSNKIFVAFFDIFGEELSRQAIYEDEDAPNTRDPQIIWDGDGFMVAWLEIASDLQKVMMRRFDESGRVVNIDGAEEGQDLFVGGVLTDEAEPLITNLTLLPTDSPGRALVGWIEPSCRGSETDGCVHLTYSDDGNPDGEEVIPGSERAETMALATTGTKHFVAWREREASTEVEWRVIGSTLNQNMDSEVGGTISTGLISYKHISADVADGHFVLAHTALVMTGEMGRVDERVRLSVFEMTDMGNSQTIDISANGDIAFRTEVVGMGDRAIVTFYENRQTSRFASVNINENMLDTEGVLLELELETPDDEATVLMSLSPVALARGPSQSVFFAHSFKDDGSTDVAWMLTSQGGAPLCIEGDEGSE